MRQFLGFGNGSDGAKTVSGTETVNVYTEVSGSNTAGSTTINVSSVTGFSANDFILIHKTRGNTTVNAGSWEVNSISSIGTGAFNLFYPLVHSFNSDGGANKSQIVKIRQYTTLTVPSGATLTGNAWNGATGGIIALSGQSLTVSGVISANELGFSGGGGSHNGTAWTGESHVGSSLNQRTANGSGGGGGQDGTGSGDGGVAWLTDASLSSLFGFGGGGGGSAGQDTMGAQGYSGGGCILLFFSMIEIASSGEIRANGGGGGALAQGRGAGGSILIKGRNVSISTDKVIALGGTMSSWPSHWDPGGGGAGATNGFIGYEPGRSNGRIRIDACLLFGSTTLGEVSTVVGGHPFCGRSFLPFFL